MISFGLLQYNVHKSWDVMATFLRDEKVLAADVVAVQEPWRNDKNRTTHQPATAEFQLLYPKSSEPNQPGVCFFISKKINPRTWSCQQISTDYQILKVRRAHQGRDWTDLFIHNIYNRPGSGTFEMLREELTKRPFGEHIVVGDMNVHHPAWGGPGTRIDREAEDLLLIMDEQGLQLTTEEGMETWSSREQSSVIDLTFF
jgi:hypothetical protein